MSVSSIDKSDLCPVCPLAKQKRLPFISHNNMYKSAFDLVHIDVWGPFSVESVEDTDIFLLCSMIVHVVLGFT